MACNHFRNKFARMIARFRHSHGQRHELAFGAAYELDDVPYDGYSHLQWHKIYLE